MLIGASSKWSGERRTQRLVAQVALYEANEEKVAVGTPVAEAFLQCWRIFTVGIWK